jgi:hypothetical protein
MRTGRKQEGEGQYNYELWNRPFGCYAGMMMDSGVVADGCIR